MRGDFIGRCYVEVPTRNKDWLDNYLTVNIYFKNYKTAHIFACRYSKKNNCFLRIFEYRAPCYDNDFTEGYNWITSYKNGRICASINMTAIELERILKNG